MFTLVNHTFSVTVLNTELHGKIAVRTQWWWHDQMCYKFYNSECARCLELHLSSQGYLCKAHWLQCTARWTVKASRPESLLSRAWWALPPGGCSKACPKSAHPWVTCRRPLGGSDSAGLGLDVGSAFLHLPCWCCGVFSMNPLKTARF